MKKTLNVECPCGHWNTVLFSTVFFEPPSPEPKARMMKRMYEPVEETKCSKCGSVIAKLEELFDMVEGKEAVRYRVKYSG